MEMKRTLKSLFFQAKLRCKIKVQNEKSKKETRAKASESVLTFLTSLAVNS